MKNETITTLTVTLIVIILGIQVYATFRLNDRLNLLLGSENQQTIKPYLSRPSLPKLAFEDSFIKGKPWKPYEEKQHETEQMFGDSFSSFHMHPPLEV